MMEFYEILDHVIDLLKQRGRASYRALKVQFHLDDESLEALKEELVDVHQHAVDYDGKMLVWTGEIGSPEPDAQRAVDEESRFHELILTVIGLLQCERRVTYRRVKHIFGLDDALLDEIREDLSFRGLARDQDGKGLVWTGEPHLMTPSVVDASSQASAAPAPSLVTEPIMPSNGPAVPAEDIATDILQDESITQSEPTRSAPEAERRQLTVMFCDLADSTKLSQQLDPEDLREVIRAYQQTSSEVVQHFDGYVAQHLGDGLLIYFGWPRAHEDDAQRALHSGLGIVEAITTTLNPRLESERGVKLMVRLGIHTGPVVVGQMGSDGRQENLAMGETVNIAARLEGLAHANTVVISSVTERLLQGAFTLEDLGLQNLKGVTEPMQIFRVLSPAEVHRDEDESMPDGGVFLVGRDEEIGLLLRRWEQAKEGHGQVVLLSGEAGIGKSSLVSTVRAHVMDEGHTRITFRCSPYHTNSALYPVITHLEQMLGFERDDTPGTKLDKLEQALKTTSLPLEESVPLLATLLSVPLEDRYLAPTQSAQQQRQLTLDTLVGWLIEESEKQPVLAVWEDLHWSDPSTLEMLGLMVEQSPTAAILNLLTFRPEFESPWPSRSHMTPITLNRLERPQVEALITHMADDKPLPAEVAEHIVTKTDGVPLYVEELTKMLLTSDLLREETDQYVLTGPLNTVAIPDTLQDSLMARLDQLNQAKEVAQLGAVIGREFSYDILQAVSSQDQETLQSGLAQLVEAELLYQRGRPPRAKYIFKHALIQDAAYASLLRSQRQQVHQRIAQVLEKQFPETTENQPELVAYHAMQGEGWDKAVVYSRQAATKAMDHSAHREAVSYFEQALRALAQLPESRDRMAQDIDLRLDLRNALLPLGEQERMIDHMKRAETLAEALDDPHRLGRIFGNMCNYFMFVGSLDRAVEYGRRTLSLAMDHNIFNLKVQANAALGLVYHELGEYRQAIASMQACIALLEGDLIYEQFGRLAPPSVTAHMCLTSCLAELGDFDKGLAVGEEGVRIAEVIDQPYSFVIATVTGISLVHHRKGDFSAAIPMLQRSLTLCQNESIEVHLPATVALLIPVYAHAGRIAETRTLLELVETGITFEKQFNPAAGITQLGEGYLLVGDLQEAQARAEQALSLATVQKERGNQAWALRLLGDIAMHRDPPDIEQAETHYHQALTLANELGMRPLQAHCHRGLGKVYSQTGQMEQARAELSMAINMYREMEMTFWVPETDAALADVEGR